MTLIHIALIADSENNVYLTSPLHASEFVISDRFNHPQQFEERANPHHIIVIDTEIAGMDVLSAIKMLISKSIQAKIIVICTKPDVHQAREWIQVGVTGIILRHEISSNFIYFVRTVYAGHIVISPVILKQLLA